MQRIWRGRVCPGVGCDGGSYAASGFPERRRLPTLERLLFFEHLIEEDQHDMRDGDQRGSLVTTRPAGQAPELVLEKTVLGGRCCPRAFGERAPQPAAEEQPTSSAIPSSWARRLHSGIQYVGLASFVCGCTASTTRPGHPLPPRLKIAQIFILGGERVPLRLVSFRKKPALTNQNREVRFAKPPCVLDSMR